MNCPHCGADTRVIDSRPSGPDIRRRRECPRCGKDKRFTTYETVVEDEPDPEPDSWRTVAAELNALARRAATIADDAPSL